jgi:hypothetical protein
MESAVELVRQNGRHITRRPAERDTRMMQGTGENGKIEVSGQNSFLNAVERTGRRIESF